MGESSAPRRPTHDTNTSRRQVKTQTHISTTTTTTTLHQIQTYHEDCWIDCIYFDASSCCYGFNSFCKGHGSPLLLRRFDDQACKIHENKCCWAGRFLSGDRVAKCQNKPSNPNDCFAPRQKKEIKHGELMGKNCCWQGVFRPKAKCETQVSHPDNCYAAKLGKEIMHGEIGPLGKACCWYGKWANKSNCGSAVVG